MGLLNIIRRMALREKLSIREISRRTGLSRNTITKHLNAGTIEAQFTTPERQSKLDPFADKLAGRPEIPHGSLPDSIADVWTQEQAASMPLPCAFDGFVEHSKRVSPSCLINFERNRYSVPASFANCPVSLRVSPDRLVVAAEGQALCEHPRVIDRSQKHPPYHTNGHMKRPLV